MDIEHLKTFISVAKHGSFSVAAEQLHLTQPAVSKRVLALESKIGSPLFDRVNKQVVLSPMGTELLPKAEAILQNFDDMLQSANKHSNEIRGELHIATSHHLGLHKLPKVLESFANQYPQVNLRLDFLDSEVAFKRVLDGTCEITVATIAPEIPSMLISETLWEEPLVFVTSHQSQIPKQLKAQDLSNYPALLPDQSTYTGRLISQFFREENINLLVNMSTNYFETLKMLVGIGFGWSALPAPVVDESLKTLEVENVSLIRKLGIIHHKKRTLSPQAQQFLKHLRSGQ